MPSGMKSTVCDPANLNGMSKKLVLSDDEKNHGGAVKRLNAIEGALAALDFAAAPVFIINVINGLKRTGSWLQTRWAEVFPSTLGDTSKVLRWR